MWGFAKRAAHSRSAGDVMTIEYRNAAPEKAERKQIPAWAIITGLVLALAIAVGVIWFFVWGSSPKRRTVAVDPSKTAAAPLATPQMRVRRPPRPISAVNKISDNKWRVQGDSGGLAV